MVTERKEREAKTFLEKKGTGYAINNASLEEKEYFDGILYVDGKPTLYLLSYLSSHVYNLLSEQFPKKEIR